MLKKKFSAETIARAERLYKKYGLFTVLIPSILPPPTPFKIFVLSAGAFKLRALEFISAILIGRTIRYSMWGVLAVLYGNSVKLYMQQNLEQVGLVLFGIFAFFAVTASLFYLRRNRMARSKKAS
jgi:membrane protein DedA with SNARE-associated domain